MTRSVTATAIHHLASVRRPCVWLRASTRGLGICLLLAWQVSQSLQAQAPTNHLAYVADVSIKDGTWLLTGEPFVKTWRVSNVGTNAWRSGSNGFYFATHSGQNMGRQEKVFLNRDVPPGAIIEVSVPMVAPEKSGSFTNRWRMRSVDGNAFGPPVGCIINVETRQARWEKRAKEWLPTIALAGAVLAGCIGCHLRCVAKLKGEIKTLQRESEVKVSSATRDERERFRRDLHDGLRSEMTQLAVLVEAAKLRGPTVGNAALPLDRISLSLRSVDNALKDILWAPNDDAVTLPQLVARIRSKATEFLDPAGIGHDFPATALPEHSLSPIVRQNLLLIASELLTNIVKHSRASHVRIEAECGPAGFTLRIADNGCGFSVSAATSAGHGLANLNRRVTEELHGEMEIKSDSTGTTVRVFVPLPESKGHA